MNWFTKGPPTCNRRTAAALLATLTLCGATWLGAASSFASDLYGAERELPPERPLIIDPWNGPYIGAHLGVGAMTGLATDWGRTVLDEPDGDWDVSDFAKIWGIHAGYNRQFGNILFGVEADYARSDFETGRDMSNGSQRSEAELEWLATFRARFGLAVDNALFYVTAGAAYAHLQHCANDYANLSSCAEGNSAANRPNISWQGTKWGFVAGGGVEAAIHPDISLKTEYLFLKMDNQQVDGDGTSGDDLDFSNRAHILRVGLNYHLHGLPVYQYPERGPWEGLYAGLHGAFGSFTGFVGSPNIDLYQRPDGDFDLYNFAGAYGLQIGYNRQSDYLVYGIEADIARTSFDEDRGFQQPRDGIQPDTQTSKNYAAARMQWLASVRARLGVAVGNAMAYATAGIVFAKQSYCARSITSYTDDELQDCDPNLGPDVHWRGTQKGLIVGIGAEAAFHPNWSIKGEYTFVQMESVTAYSDESEYIYTEADFGSSAHLARMGLNYHFRGLEVENLGSGPWDGRYVGLHGGVGAFTGQNIDWDYNAFNGPDGDFDLNDFAGLGGVQIGFYRQVGNAVWGLQTDFTWTGFDASRKLGDPETLIDDAIQTKTRTHYVSSELDWYTMVRGKLGLAVGNAMGYTTAGVVLGDQSVCANLVETTLNDPAYVDLVDVGTECEFSKDGLNFGFTAGFGVEWLNDCNWSWGSEYLFVQMDKKNYVYDEANGSDMDFSNRIHLFRFGLNYRLNNNCHYHVDYEPMK